MKWGRWQVLPLSLSFYFFNSFFYKKIVRGGWIMRQDRVGVWNFAARRAVG